MRKAILFFIIIELLRFEATAQDPFSLRIVGTNSNVTLSWTNGYAFSILQSTTNLSLPIFWNTELIAPFQTTQLTLPIAYPQQLFRLAPMTPLFQYAIFYNLDLEISINVPETINSKVFCNGNIWLWPYAQVTFNDTVAASLSVLNQENPNNPVSTNNYVQPVFAGGPPVSGAAPLDLSTRAIDSVSSNLFQTFLNLPPEGLGAPNPNAYSQIGQTYIYNQVDLIISNSANGKNLTAFYQDANNMSVLTQIPFDVTNIVSMRTNFFYSFVTNVSFYDYRESNTVKAVQIDIGKFNTWLTNGGAAYKNQSIMDKAHPINSIYIYNNIPLTGTTLPAVRIIDGAILPSGGLTIATPQPLYVLGNYNASASDLGTTNVADTIPAALMCDAVTVLSANWNDTPNIPLHARNPVSTTVNAAILTGIVPSITVNGVPYYSGSWENILRLLENWNLNTTSLTYNGSTVAAFSSQYATNYWQPAENSGNNSGYYNIPARNWNFDSNFSDFTKLPPLTPYVANFITP